MDEYVSPMLLEEHPLVVRPKLACAVGLNEAIVLQQIQYWTTGGKGHKKDGRMWVYNSVAQWHEQFPFWSEVTIKRALTALRNRGILLATSVYNKMAMDKTLWYAIDHARLDEYVREVAPSDQNDLTIGSDPTMSSDCTDDQINMTSRLGQNELMEGINMTQAIPETTQETSPENTPETNKLATKVASVSTHTSTKRVLPPLNTAIAEECYAPGYLLTDGDWARVSQAAQVLTAKNATPEQVRERVAIYKGWGDYVLHPQAIVKHWDRLGEEPVSFAQKKEALREDRNRNVFANFLAGGD